MRSNLRTVAILLTVVAAVAPLVPPAVGSDRRCPQFPPGFALAPGDTVRTGGTAVMLGAVRVPSPADPGPGDADREDAGTLRLDLFARFVDRTSGVPRAGSLVPGLAVTFAARGSEGVLASGEMTPRLTPDGPAYGAVVPFPVGAERIRVSLAIVDPGSGPASDPDGSGCQRVPANLVVDLDVAGLPTADRSAGASVDAPGDDRNARLVGTLDPRPGNDYNDVWGYSDGTTYLAILGGENGTSFIDVTVPEAPVEVAFVVGPNSSWRDVKTYGENAYIVSQGSGLGAGLQIVDLSDPLVPVFVRTDTTSFTTAQNLWVDVPRGHLWAVGTGGGTLILDVATDPENPVEIASWTQRYVHDAYVADGWAYFSEINDGLHEILDASEVSDLTVLSSWETPAGASHNSWADADHAIVATTDEAVGGHVGVYDIESKTGPNPLLSEYRPDPGAIVHNVQFDDTDDALIAIAHYGLGLKVVDVHRPTQPVEWMSYDTLPSGDAGFDGAWGVYAFDPRGYFYVSDIQTGLYILEYEPSGGTLSGVVRDAVGGQPVAGARVVQLSDGAVSRTGADGVYALYGTPGTALVRIDAWGYRSAVVEAGSVLPGERLDADLVLEPLPRVGLSGVVRRADTGDPLAGVTVRIADASLATVTAADGSYAFPEVAVGPQTVLAERFGFAAADLDLVVAAGRPATLDVSLEPGAFADDMEADRGWTFWSEVVDQDGEWERGEPNGTGGGTVQPGVDATPGPGVAAWVTGNEFGATIESDDVDEGATTLVSPVIDASGFDAAVIGYQRWVSTDAGFLAAGAFDAEVSSDDGASWSTLETRTSSAAAWTSVRHDAGAVTGLTDRMRVRFVARPNTALTDFRVLEAAVDDFEVVRGCRARFNPAAPDADADRAVDACDPCPRDAGDDADADGVCGDLDNAPAVANSDQADGDGDGIGDVADNCPGEANDGQHDTDRDGVGDACDDDIDGDGVPNALDADRDGDGVEDPSDNCPDNANGAQADRDADGVGDACDPDDGVVHRVRLDDDRVVWAPESGAEGYHLYRGDLGAAALVSLAACRAAAVAGTSYVDRDLPRPHDGFFYLVARVVAGVGGSLGEGAGGAERSIGAACP